jgi:methyltransferase-like protein
VALQTLAEKWPDSIHFEDLLEATLQRVSPQPAAVNGERDGVSRQLGAELLRCYSHGLIECHVAPNPFTLKVSEKPATTPLVRYQAQNNRPITSLRHELVGVDQFGRQLLTRLDGSQNAAELTSWMCAEAARGKISVKVNELQVSDPTQLQRHLSRLVGTMLPRLAQAALLTS